MVQFDTVYGRRLTGSGTVTTTDTIVISTQADNGDAAPDVVYLAATGQYQTIWTKGNFGFENGDIHGRVVYPDGSLGSVQTIAAASQHERGPRLAVDSSGMLVVWQKLNSSGYDLYARPLDNSGLPNGDPFVIQETAGNQQNTAIAYGSNRRYQLAWQDDREVGWDLFTASLDRSYQVTHIQHEYDPLYRLTKANYNGDITGTYAYAYDALGNRLVYTATITSTVVTTYTYNAANQLITVKAE